METEKTNLPRLKRSQYQQSNQLGQVPRQENDQSSPKNPRSSRIKRLMRNSGEKKPHHHYPGSTPLNDNFDLNNPPTQKNFEYTFDNSKQECQARLIPPKVPKRQRKWRHLLEKKQPIKNHQSTTIDLNSDTLNELINERGTMVFSSDGDGRTKEEREREYKERLERKQKEEEMEELQRSRENAMKELEMKRALEAEKVAKKEMEEEKKLLEKQLQMLRDNAIIGEDSSEKEQPMSIQEKIERSRKKK